MSQNCLSVGDYHDLMALGNYQSVDNPALVALKDAHLIQLESEIAM